MTFKHFSQIWRRFGFKLTGSSALLKSLRKAADGDHSDFDRIQSQLSKHDAARHIKKLRDAKF